MVLATLGTLVNGACMPIFSIVFGKMIDSLGSNLMALFNLREATHRWILYYLYVGVGGFVGAAAQEYFWTLSSARQVRRIREKYVASALRQEIGYYEAREGAARLLQGVNEDCQTLQGAIGDKAARTLFCLTQAVVGLIVAFTRGWDMTLVMLAIMPLLGVATALLATTSGRMTSRMNAAYADAGALAQSALGNVRTVYAFNASRRTVAAYDASLAAPVAVGVRQGLLAGCIVGATNLVAFCCYALALWYGSTRVIAGKYTGGEVLNVLMAALVGGFALGQAAPNMRYFQEGRAAAARVFAVIDRQPAVDDDAAGDEPVEVCGEIELKDVHFRYPSRPDVPVLRGLTVRAPAGSHLALVGSSGSGKSTIIALLERFYDPDRGVVLLDGIDVRGLRLAWLRRQLALVSQEPALFATTVRENVRYGRPDATDEEVERACRAANAYRFISSLPDGFDTQVGEKGTQLSGGQKQRVAIARAILRDPKVLLLDEATSALDSKSEKTVQRALDALMHGRTTVTVAHRLSTVVGADAIAVVDKGRVVQLGRHAELVKEADGPYALLVAMQQGRHGAADLAESAARRRARGVALAKRADAKASPRSSVDEEEGQEEDDEVEDEDKDPREDDAERAGGRGCGATGGGASDGWRAASRAGKGTTGSSRRAPSAGGSRGVASVESAARALDGVDATFLPARSTSGSDGESPGCREAEGGVDGGERSREASPGVAAHHLSGDTCAPRRATSISSKARRGGASLPASRAARLGAFDVDSPRAADAAERGAWTNLLAAPADEARAAEVGGERGRGEARQASRAQSGGRPPLSSQRSRLGRAASRVGLAARGQDAVEVEGSEASVASVAPSEIFRRVSGAMHVLSPAAAAAEAAADGAEQRRVVASLWSRAMGRGGSESALRRVVRRTTGGFGSSAPPAVGSSARDELNQEDLAKNVSFKRLGELNRPELPALFGGLVGSAALGIMMPIFSIAFSALINVFFLSNHHEMRTESRKWSCVFVGIGGAAFIFSILQAYSFNLMGHRLARRVRVLTMTALMRQEVGWFDRPVNNSGVLSSKLSTDALAVKGQFGDSMGLIAQNIVTFVGGYAIAFSYGWKMTLVVTAMVPSIVLSVILSTVAMTRASRAESSAFALSNAVASEAFLNVRTVAAFGAERDATELYAGKLAEPLRRAKQRGLASATGLAFTTFTMFAIYAVAFYYATILISNGERTFLECMRVFFAIVMAAFGVAQAQMFFPDVAKGKAATQRVFGIVDRVPLIDADSDAGVVPVARGEHAAKGEAETGAGAGAPAPPALKSPSSSAQASGEPAPPVALASRAPLLTASPPGEVVLEHVTFSYPQRPEAVVFDDFSLRVPAGWKVALVGESGSGKSTVVGLVERFYDPQAGRVLLDGVDVRELNIKWLRDQLGLVGQEPALFPGTVVENVRYGKEDASMEEVVAACRAANAHGFVEALPEGYDTKLGPGGVQLSGGQKQRVAIARAILKDPKVLLLDEATSALDAESERLVQDALDALMKNRTTIVVAHRLSTIRDADLIAVVYQGKIVESGTHDELVAKGCAYAKLVQHQLLDAAPTAETTA